ncbi:MAG: hypothetical protein KUG77_18055 [Nannocystaceae bacterium]|nr:hypothetical protein [Nannocystaceae bacterium]
MPSLRPQLACAPLAFALACASSPKGTEAPQCPETQPTIVVSDPAMQSPTRIIPQEPELVSMRLFVVSAAGDNIDDGLPESIRSSPTCASGCTLLFSPMLLGRSRSEAELEVGSGSDQNLFSLKVQPRLSEDHVELKLRAGLAIGGDGEPAVPHQLSFEGLLEPGELTHVGTFHAEDRRGHTVGPQLFIMAQSATPDEA